MSARRAAIAWDAATDNSGKLSYEMRLWVVMGITRTVAYGSTTGPYTFVLKAVDAAGNSSLSNPVTLDLFC